MSEHACQPPDIAGWIEQHNGYDQDWKCAECEQEWWVGSKDYCHSCLRSDGPQWERYGRGDGKFPLVTAPRGGIQFKMTGDKP